MRILLTFLALAGFTLTVNAGPPAKEQPKTGTIIVYRPTGMGMLASFQFNLDHGPSIKLSNNRYFRLTVIAGDHIISHDNTFLAGQDPQKVHVEAGQTVYFIYHANGMWLAFEVADDQTQAAETVSRMKPQN